MKMNAKEKAAKLKNKFCLKGDLDSAIICVEEILNTWEEGKDIPYFRRTWFWEDVLSELHILKTEQKENTNTWQIL